MQRAFYFPMKNYPAAIRWVPDPCRRLAWAIVCCAISDLDWAFLIYGPGRNLLDLLLTRHYLDAVSFLQKLGPPKWVELYLQSQ